MGIYNKLIIGIFLLATLSNLKFKNIYVFKFLRIIIFILLFIISAFRFNVGTDYSAYLLHYKYLLNGIKYDNGMELGYNLLMKITTFFSDDVNLIFIVTSFIIIYFFVYVMSNYSERFEMSCFLFLVLYFYFNSFNIIRQYIAIAIIFYSIKYIINNNKKKFFLSVFIAILFHKTAFIAIILYYIKDKEFSFKNIVYTSVISIIMVPIIPICMKLLFKVFPKYSIYINYTNNQGISATSIIILSILIFGTILKKKLIKKNTINNLYINCMLIALLLQNLSINNTLFSRLSMYFYIFSILLIPAMLNSIDKNIRIPIYICIIILGILWCNYLLYNNNSGVIPYNSLI